MELSQIVVTGLIVFAGGLFQGTVAFGFGLLVVPLLMMLSLPVPVVLALSAACTAVQSASGVHHLREDVPWKDVWMSMIIRLLTMLLGIWILHLMVKSPVDRIKFWVGTVVLLMVLVQAVWQPKPRPKLNAGWNVTAFLASGFTLGLCSMGGPPLVLWVMAHDWTTGRTRAFLFAAFMFMVPFQLAALWWTFGDDVLRGIVLGLTLSPFVLLGSMLGLRIGSRFSKPVLRRAAFTVLVAIALNAIYPQIWQWVR